MISVILAESTGSYSCDGIERDEDGVKTSRSCIDDFDWPDSVSENEVEAAYLLQECFQRSLLTSLQKGNA